MGLGIHVFSILILLGLLSFQSLSNSDLISPVNSIEYGSNEGSSVSHQPNRTVGPQPLIENTHVEIVKSFKNSSGFYKIDGTIENNASTILTHIQVIKYYKLPSVNHTTLVCYKQSLVNCEYKSVDNPLPSKSFFMMMPPTPPPQTDIH
jgi:hypothetical protein